jgi:hypothetical protein
VAINFQAAKFEALRAAANPNGTSYGPGLSLITLPGGVPRGGFGASADLLTLFLNPGAMDIDLGTLHYGNPFPAEWGTVAAASCYFGVTYQAPGAGSTVTRSAAVIVELDGATLHGPIAPLVGPPSNPQVAGLDAFTARSGIGTTPTVSWGPPAVGTATSYRVTVVELYADAGKSNSRSVAVLRTVASSVQIPPGVMAAGKAYYLRIAAVTAASGDITTHPYRYALPDGSAELLTATIVP